MYESLMPFDLETGTNILDKRRASRWHPDNYIVAAGWARGDGKPFGTYYDKRTRVEVPDLSEVKMLIGFNIKFDLLWMWEYEEFREFFKRGGTIWDCQYAEYLLEGHQQHAQMCSLDSIIEKYNGTLKLDAVKVMWEQGMDTPEIPPDVLMKYLLGDDKEDLAGDVKNTWTVFLGQLARIQENYPPQFMQMVRNRMDGVCATTEMEYNGLKIDQERGMELQARMTEQLKELDEKLHAMLPQFPPEFEFKWTSNHHRSALVYGGTLKYDKWIQDTDDETGELLYAKKVEKWPLVDGLPVNPDELGDLQPDTFKSGKRVGEVKTKNVSLPDLSRPKGAKREHHITLKGYTKPEPSWKSTLLDAKGHHIYSTSADIIEQLAARDIPFLKLMQKRQKMQKDLGTYYWTEDKNGNRKGMLTLINEEDGCIHHKLNHTSTVTSRLSSSDPNMQNLPTKEKSDVKQLFVSRFGEDGVMAEIDYSQLEVVIQGILSKDPQLLKDLNAKTDFHCKRLSIKLGERYEDVVHKVKVEEDENYIRQRKNIKSFTFERAYGAGPASISANNDIPLDEVEELIRIEESMYPGVVRFDQMVEQSIIATRRPTATELFIDGQRVNIAKGEWFAPTGTRYVWTESEAPEFLRKRGKLTGFKPTERKNWPVQGTGGEVVQTMLGLLWRWFVRNDNFGGRALLVNTVHDCVWIDMHKSLVDTVVPTACKILEAVPQKFNLDFNMDITVPFPVEAEVGPDMYNLHPYHR